MKFAEAQRIVQDTLKLSVEEVHYNFTFYHDSNLCVLQCLSDTKFHTFNNRPIDGYYYVKYIGYENPSKYNYREEINGNVNLNNLLSDDWNVYAWRSNGSSYEYVPFNDCVIKK